jgi:hypothetical protein
MGGGKSSSDSSSQTSTQTSTGTATGTVGDVVQGQQITINQDLPDAAVDVFKQLVALSGQAIEIAAVAGGKALDSNAALAQATKAPDVTLAQGYQKQVLYGIGAIAVVAVVVFLGKK